MEEQATGALKTGPLFVLGWLLLVIVVLVGVGALVRAHDLSIREQSQALEAQDAAGVPVTITHLTRAAVEHTATYPGDVHGFFESPIYPKVSGYVKEVLVDKGARVSKGQLLALIESPELDQQVQNARANYQMAALTDSREQALVRRQVVSAEEADQAHATMLQALATENSLKAQQAYERVTAPYSGVITARNVDPGALVAVATAQTTAVPIATMATLRPVRIYVYMPQDEAAFVKDGDPATITVAQLPGRVFHGAVTRHPEALMSSTRTMLVEVDLPNDDLALFPGMYAHVAIRVAGLIARPLVPDDVLVYENGETFIPIVRDGRIHLAPVKLGYDDGIRSEILDGVKGDELVALTLGQSASEGQKVRSQMLANGVR